MVVSISEFVHHEWRLFYIQYSVRKSENGLLASNEKHWWASFVSRLKWGLVASFWGGCDYFKGRKYEVGRVYSKLDQGYSGGEFDLLVALVGRRGGWC